MGRKSNFSKELKYGIWGRISTFETTKMEKKSSNVIMPTIRKGANFNWIEIGL